MKTSLQLVAISQDSVSAPLPCDELHRLLVENLEGLELSLGVEGLLPAHQGEKEAEGPAYRVYLVEGSYPGSLQELRALAREKELEQVGGFSVNFAPLDLRNDEKKLLIMDVDSTLIRQEVIDELAGFAGKSAEVAEVTERAMRGELDFEASLRERVKALAGQPESILEDVHSLIFYTPGARRLVSAFLTKGHAVAVVSGGFAQVLEPLAQDLKLTYARANILEVQDGVLTGGVLGRVIDAQAKKDSLLEWAEAEGVSPSQVIAVGDGANDLLMTDQAALGVAFMAKPALAEAADARINTLRLDAVRHFVGL